VPKALLDRVEVIEGGSSNLYGNGAMGGVISFFSRPVAPGTYHVQGDYGSRDARHGFAAVGVPIAGPLSAMLSGDYGDGGGYTLIAPGSVGAVDHPSESIRRNALARLEYAPTSNLSAFVTGHLFSDNRDLGSPLAQTNRRSSSVDVGLNYGTSTRGTLTLRAWDSEMREDQYTSAIAANRATERRTAWLRIPSHDWGGGLQWSRGDLFGFQSIAVGGDYRHMSGNTSEIDYAANGTTSSVFSGGDQVLSGAFVQGVLAPLTPVRVELGARVDHWGNNDGLSRDATGTTIYEDRSRTAFSPRVGVRYQVVSNFSLHAAGYQAFRAPNLAELYRKFVSGTNTNLPNPGLKPEFATGYEAGFDWQPASWIQLKGTGFSADMRDLNTFVTIGAGQRQRQNVQKSRARGGEAYVALRPAQPLFVSASVSYDNARLFAGPTGTVVGSRVSRVPMQKQVVRVSYTTPLVGSLTVIGRHEGVTTTFSGVGLEPFTVVDANYQHELLRGLNGFVSVENVANTEYQVNLTGTIVSLGMPRTIRVGLEAFRY
jgi:iron complex outermembrane receptor protein